MSSITTSDAPSFHRHLNAIWSTAKKSRLKEMIFVTFFHGISSAAADVRLLRTILPMIHRIATHPFSVFLARRQGAFEFYAGVEGLEAEASDVALGVAAGLGKADGQFAFGFEGAAKTVMEQSGLPPALAEVRQRAGAEQSGNAAMQGKRGTAGDAAVDPR